MEQMEEAELSDQVINVLSLKIPGIRAALEFVFSPPPTSSLLHTGRACSSPGLYRLVEIILWPSTSSSGVLSY